MNLQVFYRFKFKVLNQRLWSSSIYSWSSAASIYSQTSWRHITGKWSHRARWIKQHYILVQYLIWILQLLKVIHFFSESETIIAFSSCLLLLWQLSAHQWMFILNKIFNIMQFEHCMLRYYMYHTCTCNISELSWDHSMTHPCPNANWLLEQNNCEILYPINMM